jgi:putative peptidoglycan lipid II flippase
LLGVAVGVVLMPQLAAAKAAHDSQRYSAMLDWGLRLVVLLAVPCAVALLTVCHETAGGGAVPLRRLHRS